MADTCREKLKDSELQILQTQWPMGEAKVLVDPLANELGEVKPQTS